MKSNTLKALKGETVFRNSCRFHICSKSVRYAIKLSQSKRRSIESGDTVLFIDYPRLFLFYTFNDVISVYFVVMPITKVLEGIF